MVPSSLGELLMLWMMMTTTITMMVLSHRSEELVVQKIHLHDLGFELAFFFFCNCYYSFEVFLLVDEFGAIGLI